MRFHGFQGSGVGQPGAACGSLWQAAGPTYIPTRKNVVSLNPSKEQGARLDLSSMVWFSWIPSNFIDFHWISSISWIWEVSGENAGSFKRGPAAPTRKNVGSLNPSKEQGARLDLSSLGWFSWISLNFIDFHRISWISWIWEVSGESAGSFKVQPAAPTRKLGFCV